MIQKASEFERKYGMTQAFGCSDGTHVPILRPIENFQDYYCKVFSFLTGQTVCDYSGLFMDVDCRWAGSVHDTKVFCNSKTTKNSQDEKQLITHQKILPGCQKVGNYLICDPTYPLTTYCLKKHSTCSSNA